MSSNSTTPPVAKVLLGCAKCGATLPDEAQYCLKCGNPVSLPPKTPVLVETLPLAVRRPRRTRPIIVGILLAVWRSYSLGWDERQPERSVGAGVCGMEA